MSAAMELHVALSLRLDAIEAYRLSNNYRDEVLAEVANPADTATIYAVRPCVCDETPHPTWCPASIPTDDRITEIRQGIGEPLTPRELFWLKGAAGRHELHVIGARGGHWPLTDDLPGAVLLVSQYLAAAVAVIERADLAEEKATDAPSATATPVGAVFDPLPSYLHAIGHAGSETERGLYAGYVQAIAEVARLQVATDASSGLTGRVAQLLDAIRTHRGEWTTKRAQDFYRGTPLAPPNARNGRLRHVARGDLRDLHTWGHLVLHEETGRRFYTLKTRKDARS